MTKALYVIYEWERVLYLVEEQLCSFSVSVHHIVVKNCHPFKTFKGDIVVYIFAFYKVTFSNVRARNKIPSMSNDRLVIVVNF